MINDFVVRLGTEITELEAYNNVGNIPVYTSAVNGIQYYVDEHFANTKTTEFGPALVWSRLGNAGSLQLVECGKFCTSDKSGVIKIREDKKQYWDLEFAQKYIEFKLKQWLISQENIGQINTAWVKSTKLKRIPIDIQRKFISQLNSKLVR